MSLNEQSMKSRGEKKVNDSIKSNNGDYKSISSSQIGQQILFDEALRIFPDIKQWIEKDCAKAHRKAIAAAFPNDEFLLQKVTEILLFISGSIYVSENGRGAPSRQARVATIQSRILPDLSFEHTWRFLEVIIDYSDYYSVEKLLTSRKGELYWSVKYTSTLSDDILAKLALDAVKAFYPLPMLETPEPWKVLEGGKVKGGFKTFQYEMVRAKRKVDYSKFSQHIFDTVNYIQSVAWVVNKHLLHQVREDLKEPLRGDFVKSRYPDPESCQWEIDLKDDDNPLSPKLREELREVRKIFNDALALFNAEVGDFESAVGKYRAVDLALRIAEGYKDDIIYFPHNYDFRGRIYPIPIGLSPQGSDAVKALLDYEKGEVLNEAGEAWAWAYLASLYGDDKIPFAERILRGKELLSANYLDADEPYQFLAHQIELNKFLADEDYEFKGRIHLDACNSGSQFTSAITGDKAGCIATNVIPTINTDGSQSRQDAYLLVAEKSKELTKLTINTSDDEEQILTLKFILDLLEKSGRKICKRPVMVSNYGGTTGGRTDILWNMMRELGCERHWITRKNAALFSKIVGDSISGVLNGGKAFEGYIQKMNNLIAKGDTAVTWTTSDGFYVVHMKNKELKSKRVSCKLPGARRVTTIIKKMYSESVSPAKMKSAISPNYIHSLDAELLRRCALKMMRAGIADSDWIHDSFGCHPNHVDLMLDITKSEFAKLARRKPLTTLDAQLRLQVGDTRANQRALNEIKIPHLRGFNASGGDLDVVFDSNWFFS